MNKTRITRPQCAGISSEAAVRPKNRVVLLLLALLLSAAMISASASPVYGATKVKLNKSKTTLTAGKTTTLKVKGTKAKITWSSSNKKIATVTRKGKVKAVKAGKATIKATYKVKKKKKTLKCVVTVKAAPVSKPAPAPKPTPPTPTVPRYEAPAKASFAKASVAVPSNDMNRIVNYAIVSLPAGSQGYSFTVNGAAAYATPVFSDGTLLKIPVPAGVTEAFVEAKSDGVAAGSVSLTFVSPGGAAPETLYGVIPMKFSEYFHDVTADGTLSTDTAFPKNGTVASPELFISQGTRTGNAVGGVDTVTYTEAKDNDLPLVDTVSTATYGDGTHFAPNANLTLVGDRHVANDPNKAITGISAAEVGASFDLYANAVILKKAGKATAQSRNVLSKLTGKFTLLNVVNNNGSVVDSTDSTVAAPEVYMPKLMLTDGNWGARTLVNANLVKELPGLGNGGESEDVAYGGTWGDKVTGFSFGTAELAAAYPANSGVDYAGANYWDNFANNIYGGVITDSEGHSEPLVFLQNLFTHRMHEDFDVAISTSRFSRLSELKSPDTYTVTVFADGFKDIKFSFDVKNYSNASAAVDGSNQVIAPNPVESKTLTINGLDNANIYVAGAKLLKGTAEVDRNLYTLVSTGRNSALFTLKTGFFTGSYQGNYSISYETAVNASKPVTFSVVNPVSVKLSTTVGGPATADGYLETSPLSVAKSGTNKVYFVGDTGVSDFASTITLGARGGSTIQNITDSAAAVALDTTALKRTGADDSPYYIDVSSSAQFQSGKLYKLTLLAPGFNNQIFFISVT
jgi:hypothetical protein